ncbi:MAG: Two-component transcriptional response regulator, LuxR family [uncultured Corynebacteriales bacterium]|uniref:Two-component transcriptional response regulator, LuxR family n=1 Tax=uncultured Mycobacteriales bacterium TaxID=581187 RepID=A0A6J4HYX1_9ACTN|nr:MAG: Two-component transcriptional response regulator, LuxR family [uncultured Corynebacteriales bacterium]
MGIGVLIADDQAVVRSGLRAMLSSAAGIDVLGEAVDGLDAVEWSARLRPDVVLMDIRMPRLDGLEATRRIVGGAGQDGPRVVVVTTFEHDEYVYGALRAGASGFLLKDVTPAGLAEAVRVAHAGDSLLAPSVTRRLIADFTRARPARARRRELGRLTARESQVLLEVAAGHSNADIAARLFLGESTVKTHVSRLLAKTGSRDRAQLVVLAYESGLVRPGGADPGDD